MNNFNQTFGCATNFDQLPESAFDGYKLRCKLLTKMGINKFVKDDVERNKEIGAMKLDYCMYFGRNFTVEQLQQMVKLTKTQLWEQYPYDNRVKGSFKLINTPYTMEQKTMGGVTMLCAVPVKH